MFSNQAISEALVSLVEWYSTARLSLASDLTGLLVHTPPPMSPYPKQEEPHPQPCRRLQFYLDT